jgi:uncharacterized protein YbjT (DUF2867 family)
MARVLVTGGTGELGRAVVARLLAERQAVRVLSRRANPGVPPGVGAVRGDLTSGVGVAAAVAGVDIVAHCASNGRRSGDVEGTRRLVAAAAEAGVRHLAYISIVGVDRNPFSYYRAKLEAEGIVEAAGVPWTILRATQFHGLILRALRAQDRLPALLAPRGFRFQPVDSSEVAARLVDLAMGGPVGRASDMGGPEVRTAEDLARAYLAAAGRRRPLLRAPIPGAVGRAFRAGAQLAPGHADGTVTWDDYLRRHLGADMRTCEG